MSLCHVTSILSCCGSITVINTRAIPNCAGAEPSPEKRSKSCRQSAKRMICALFAHQPTGAPVLGRDDRQSVAPISGVRRDTTRKNAREVQVAEPGWPLLQELLSP